MVRADGLLKFLTLLPLFKSLMTVSEQILRRQFDLRRWWQKYRRGYCYMAFGVMVSTQARLCCSNGFAACPFRLLGRAKLYKTMIPLLRLVYYCFRCFLLIFCLFCSGYCISLAYTWFFFQWSLAASRRLWLLLRFSLSFFKTSGFVLILPSMLRCRSQSLY